MATQRNNCRPLYPRIESERSGNIFYDKVKKILPDLKRQEFVEGWKELLEMGCAVPNCRCVVSSIEAACILIKHKRKPPTIKVEMRFLCCKHFKLFTEGHSLEDIIEGKVKPVKPISIVQMYGDLFVPMVTDYLLNEPEFYEGDCIRFDGEEDE